MITIALAFATLWLLSGPVYGAFLYAYCRRERKWDDFYEYMESER